MVHQRVVHLTYFNIEVVNIGLDLTLKSQRSVALAASGPATVACQQAIGVC
jgi:hypothetical protein